MSWEGHFRLQTYSHQTRTEKSFEDQNHMINQASAKARVRPLVVLVTLVLVHGSLVSYIRLVESKVSNVQNKKLKNSASTSHLSSLTI